MIPRARRLRLDGWMLVPVLATLMVNFGSVRVFEPDRSALLRIVVTVLLALMMGRLLLRADVPDTLRSFNLHACVGWLRAQPVAFAALIYGLAILVSTVTALDPRRSFLGSYERGYGSALDLAVLAMAGVLSSRARGVSAVRQIVGCAQFGIAGTALIAILQYLELVQMPTETLIGDRPVGTIGNPLFLGAVMTIGIPLGLALALGALAPDEATDVQGEPGRSPALALRQGLISAAALLVLSGGYALVAGLPSVPWLWAAWPVTIVVAATLWTGASQAPAGHGDDARLLNVTCAYTVLLIVVGVVYGSPPSSAVPGSAPWLVLALVLLGIASALPDDGRDVQRGATSLRAGRAARWLAAGGWLLVVALEAAALVLAESRGPLVGAVVGVTVTLGAMALRGGSDPAARRLALLSAPVIVAVLIATLALGAGARGDGALDFGAGTGLERRLIWLGDETGGGIAGVVARATIGRLVVGSGAESIPLLFEPSYPVALGLMIDFTVPDRAHMVLLDLLVQHGAFGLMAWAACAVLACWQCWRIAQTGESRGRILACGLLGGLVGHIVEGLSGIVVVPTLVLWWLMIGLVISLGRDTPSDATPRLPVRLQGGGSRRSRGAWRAASLLCAGAIIMTAPLHALTVLADMRLAEARAIEQRLAGADTLESRGAIISAHAEAVRLAPDEPTFLDAYADAVWRLADSAALVTAPDGASPPASDILTDPASAARFVGTATRLDLLSAARLGFEASHRARPELSSPLVFRSRVDLALFDATGDTPDLLRAIDGYRAATIRAPNQVYVLEHLANGLLQLGVIELDAGRTSEGVTYLREAKDVVLHIYAIGGSRVLRLDDRLDTVLRLLGEAG